ncbi:ankyrin repeat domain-containing protein [Novilysobacter defluvii]|uniref:ankyrin repeat domain-containing protein n=4 Tax=Novilysobacter defluvii TaxID=391738 RepID=UPI000400423A|nr:ankyrin repeat domain-containing protein [Lysobacter defluvii]
MPEPGAHTRFVAALLAIAVVLSAVAAAAPLAAAPAAWLLQPVLALTARALRLRQSPGASALRSTLPPLLALWGLGPAGFSLLVAWPFSAVLERGTLGPVLLASAATGAALLVLWRLWPLWQGIERDGGSLGDHRRALPGLEPGAWRGAGVAAGIALVAALVLLLAWPGLFAGGARWVLAGLLLAASAALHQWLQYIAPAPAMSWLDPGEEAEAPAADGDSGPAGGADSASVPPSPIAAVLSETEPEPAGAEVAGSGREAGAAAAGEGAPAPAARPSAPLEPALYEAARNGRVERALELLEQGADPHALPPPEARDQRSLAALAAVLPDLRLLRALIGRGVDLNLAHAGLSPLLAATRDSWHGRPDAVTTLLANGADPRASDGEGSTPLHFASRSSDPGVAALLLDAAAELEAANDDGWTPLGIACAAGNWRLARFLLERGARAEPEGGQPALLAAAAVEDDDPAGVALLLKHKARAGAAGRGARTALHEAALSGHYVIAEALLAAGADPAARDDRDLQPIHEAARGGHLQVLELLLGKLDQDDVAAAVLLPDDEGRDLLMHVAGLEGATPELLRRLVDAGADPARRDDEGRSALDRVLDARRWPLVGVLDPSRVLPGAGEDSDGESGQAPLTLLREALAEGREAGLADVAARLTPRELGALLHDGGAPLPPHQVEWLLARGASAEVRDGMGNTPLFDWLAHGPAAIGSLRALLARAVSPAGAGGLARYLGACAAGNGRARAAQAEAFALELLDHGADPFGAGPAGDPPLALAIRLGWDRLATRLLESGADPDLRDSHGMGPLHLAAALGRESMLQQLIAWGADPDLLAADGQSPLGVALSAGRRDLADWLDWRGWPLPRRRLRSADVPAAAIVGDVDAVRRLLDLGLPVEAVDRQGCTALLRAAGGGHGALVDLLLARGADASCTADTGATPLSAAVSMRQAGIVDQLIGAGARIEQRLPGGLTALMLSCALGLPDMAARLLGAGADIHARDDENRTALHCAAMFGFATVDRARLLALLDTLLLAGAESDLEVDAGGATPLLLLLGARAEPGTSADEQVLLAGLELLLDNDARLDVRDPRGFGPLHLAALHGLLDVARWLLRHGADPGQRDGLNRTPREIAVMRGFVDIAAEIEPPAAPGTGDVSMARFLRDRN